MQEIMETQAAEHSVGSLIREWRQRRKMSQLDLALEAGISQRHLSFVESGRAQPSRDMVLTLSENLAVPLRQRNRLLLAAGYAPSFAERTLADPALKPAMDAVQAVLDGHAPNPALAIDGHWTMLAANPAVAPLIGEIDDTSLLVPPVNVLRLSLHPKGLAPRIINLEEWRSHVLERLRRMNDSVADTKLAALERELATYPGRPSTSRPKNPAANAVAVPFRVIVDETPLSFITTTTIFGAPLDVTLSEIAIESFFPTDDSTARFLRRLQKGLEGDLGS